MIRYIIFVILVALVLTFVVQNMQVVEVKFLAWTISMSRALMIFGTLIIGIIAGWLLNFPRRRQEIKHNK
ncbi:MAG: lipopolysaccharide assembly protein LapA domain-containing protein [Planctomycetota bacterium]|jgi:uncharacterized integral membrane protein